VTAPTDLFNALETCLTRVRDAARADDASAHDRLAAEMARLDALVAQLTALDLTMLAPYKDRHLGLVASLTSLEAELTAHRDRLRADMRAMFDRLKLQTSYNR
jgi:aspartate aminotransferase-like enzyme